MNVRRNVIVILSASFILWGVGATAMDRGGFALSVLVNDSPRPEFGSSGAVYIEAVRDSEYALRITNPLPCRVAVALSVDGLNTINAKHADLKDSPKWVLGPYESIVISGWQINGAQARHFYFTGEKESYGAWLGKTANLGVIEAAFFKERIRPMPMLREQGKNLPQGRPDAQPAGSALGGMKSEQAPASSPKSKSADLSDDFAATGIGSKMNHQVDWVSLDLDRDASASLRIRYEFRPQLVKLGVLPESRPCPDQLARREHARGFSGDYCPDPYDR